MRIIFSAATAGAAAMAAMGVLGLFGSGAASAVPGVDGMTYADAVAAIEEDGGIPKVSVTAWLSPGRDGCLPRHQGAVDGSFYDRSPTTSTSATTRARSC